MDEIRLLTVKLLSGLFALRFPRILPKKDRVIGEAIWDERDFRQCKDCSLSTASTIMDKNLNEYWLIKKRSRKF